MKQKKRILLRLFGKRVNMINKKIYDISMIDIWKIYLRKKKKGQDLLDDASSFRCVLKSPFITYADPYLFEEAGKTYLLYEKQNLFTMKGILCFRCLEDFKREHVLLEKKHHLSYPFVFRLNEQVFMIPETKNSGRVELYKVAFRTNGAEIVKDLKELKAVDSTILFFSDFKGLIFTYTNNRLEIFHVFTENGSLMIDEHPLIGAEDIDHILRPGGSFFRHEDALVRPAQYCRDYYGQGLVFYNVDQADENEYRESIIKMVLGKDIFPCDNQVVGIHTYNQTEKYEVIDIKYRYKGLHITVFNILLRIIWRIRRGLRS